MDDPFENLKQGNVAYFNDVSQDVLLTTRDSNGDSLLSIAVMKQNLSCLEVIYRRCPELLYTATRVEYWHALHHAAARNDVEILKFIIKADAESHGTGTGKRLTRMLDEGHNTALMIALKNNKPMQTVKLLCDADPDFQHPPDKEDRTPLMFCMADYTRKDMFKMILEIAPNQSKTPMGLNGWTILHHAASFGDLSSIILILRFCVDCSKVVDNNGQNFIHIATQNEDADVVRLYLDEQIGFTSNVLNAQDNKGYTPLSIAASTKNESITLSLLSHPRVDIKLAALGRHLQWAVRSSKLQIVRIVIDADPDFLNGVSESVFEESEDEDGNSILSKVVQQNDLKLCKIICNRCPSLVYKQNNKGESVLHYAARTEDARIVQFLIIVVANTNKDAEKKVGIINRNTKLLIIEDGQGNTALHVAVSSHRLEVVKHLIEADPQYTYKANNSNETPLSIAIREAHIHQDGVNTGRIRRFLLEKQPNESKACKGENDWTLLHLAASQDDVNAVLDIIELCPDCLELVDNQGMNFLHIAAKFKSIQVVQRVLGGKKMPSSVLNMQDINGNTPLHIAALYGGERLTLCFLYDSSVDKMSVNKDEQHVLHAINFDYDKRKAGVYGVTDLLDQRDLKDQSDFDLVVGALIATLSFTAGITVPGGYISDGPKQGTAVLSRKVAFRVFIISNTFALLFSLYAVFSHYCTRRLIKTQDIIYQLKVATYCTLGALYAMMVAFIAGSFTVLADSTGLAISVCAICCCFYIFSFRPMWKIAMQERDGSRRMATSNSGQRSSNPSLGVRN